MEYNVDKEFWRELSGGTLFCTLTIVFLFFDEINNLFNRSIHKVYANTSIINDILLIQKNSILFEKKRFNYA